jgi:hypothetical protein
VAGADTGITVIRIVLIRRLIKLPAFPVPRELRVKSNFSSRIELFLPVQSLAKNILIFRNRKSVL